ncbi:uncharacterized protein METZ01_LOCUS332488 [marine metagenome]|uniref:Uncharacterized protein n=1 Tax=marine metagenome TaxID=408172 RepID=A0A382Q216_9ZZZZ
MAWTVAFCGTFLAAPASEEPLRGSGGVGGPSGVSLGIGGVCCGG